MFAEVHIDIARRFLKVHYTGCYFLINYRNNPTVIWNFATVYEVFNGRKSF